MSDVPTVWEALNSVKTAIGAVGKGERNTTQGFNFRGVDSVVNAAAPYLNKFGVVVTPEVLEHSSETVEIGRNKTAMAHVTLVVKYTFWGPAGDCVSSTVLAEAMDSGDKACAKAMSVAYRIALLQTLNLPTDEPDPDSESYVRENTNVTPLKATKPVQKSKVTWVYTGSGKNDSEIDWRQTISGSKTSDELNEIWKKAGEVGVLPNITDLLYKQSDALKSSKSS